MKTVNDLMEFLKSKDPNSWICPINFEKILVKFEPINDDDDLFTLEEFKKDCEDGMIMDYDGFGLYAFENKMSNISIDPDYPENFLTEFTHVVWYNK